MKFWYTLESTFCTQRVVLKSFVKLVGHAAAGAAVGTAAATAARGRCGIVSQ